MTRLRLASRETFKSLRIRNFRLFFAGQGISQIGNWLTLIAQTLLVLQLTDSGVALGVLAAAQFDGDYKLTFHLAPPLFARRDAETGHLIKREFGPWAFKAFRLLAGLKGLRGGALDIFGRTAERRMERQLIVQFEATLREIATKLDAQNHALAVEIATLPETMRGFGHVKEKNVAQAKSREANLLARFRSPEMRAQAAE